MKWICHSQRQERDFSIVLSKTMLKLSNLRKMLLIFVESLKLIKETLRRLNKISKRRNQMKMRHRSMRFYIRKKKKSMSSCSPLRMRRALMSSRLLLTSTQFQPYSSTCKRTWQDRISCQLLLNIRTKRRTWHSNKVNLRTLRTPMLDLK